MDIPTSIEKFNPGHLLSQNEIIKVMLGLTGLSGVTSFNVEEDSVMIEYYQQLLSPDMVKDALVKAGFPFAPMQKNQGVWQKFILKLGQENNKAFGGKPPKCCSTVKH
nr:hypothetical protein [Bacteroidota bacterium]